jgi:predicted alpha/beta hydrolase family esterase
MKKVFIIHGLSGSPNGGWRPWLMGELEKKDIYACALAMPSPDEPAVQEWLEEIGRHIRGHDEVYLIGHSLGATAILRYLENPQSSPIAGGILVSGPFQPTANKKVETFLNKPFNFESIRKKCAHFAIIHGDNDTVVPLGDGEHFAEHLDGSLMVVKNGQHLNGSAGWFQLPACLEALEKMINNAQETCS